MPTSTLNSGLLSSPGWTVRSLPPKITRPLRWWPINKALSYLHFSYLHTIRFRHFYLNTKHVYTQTEHGARPGWITQTEHNPAYRWRARAVQNLHPPSSPARSPSLSKTDCWLHRLILPGFNFKWTKSRCIHSFKCVCLFLQCWWTSSISLHVIVDCSLPLLCSTSCWNKRVYLFTHDGCLSRQFGAILSRASVDIIEYMKVTHIPTYSQIWEETDSYTVLNLPKYEHHNIPELI